MCNRLPSTTLSAHCSHLALPPSSLPAHRRCKGSLPSNFLCDKGRPGCGKTRRFEAGEQTGGLNSVWFYSDPACLRKVSLMVHWSAMHDAPSSRATWSSRLRSLGLSLSVSLSSGTLCLSCCLWICSALNVVDSVISVRYGW